MAEPTIKKRVLTKVRRQFIHKGPPEDENNGDHVNLDTTPEQLSINTAYILEPSIGLVETNRNICASYHFLNSYYNITSIKVDSRLGSKLVTLNIKTNDADMLPWEYCVKRLESFGDLELALWASRLKAYHENYLRLMAQYFDAKNLNDPQLIENILQAKEQARLACEDVEKNNAYVKVTLYANKNSMLPVAFGFHEKLLKDMGHTVEGFVEWTKENIFPDMYASDSSQMMDACKEYLANMKEQASFFQEGPGYSMDLSDKEGEKKLVYVKLYFVVDPAPEGFFVNIYITQKIQEPSNLALKMSESESISDTGSSKTNRSKKMKCKKLKQDGSRKDTSDTDNPNSETP